MDNRSPIITENRLGQPSTSLITFLRPRYRSILRLSRKGPYLSKFGSNVSLLVCFAVSLCAAAYMFRLIDEIYLASSVYSDSFAENIETVHKCPGGVHTCNRIRSEDMKRVLNQRGVNFDQIFERNELEVLVESTGTVIEEELAAARQFQTNAERSGATPTADALLHQRLISAEAGTWSDLDVANAQSVVFDSESSFVERVDDNKDSVWLLAVVATTCERHDTCVNSIISSEVWGALVHRYSPFGFKLGLIDCKRLPSVCHDRGFIAADLVLALPKGGDRIKDSVQFRPYPRMHTSDHGRSDFRSHNFILKSIRGWLISILSERVSIVNDFERLLPPSISVAPSGDILTLTARWLTWFRQRPQPIHVIWVPHISSPSVEGFNDELRYPPLVLSALSVPFTGRVRFWIMPNASRIAAQDDTPEGQIHRAVSQRSSKTVLDLLNILNCPKNATYLIITPETKCFAFGGRKGEFLSYPNLGMYLRFLYPSADDFLVVFSLIFNILSILNTAIEAGKLLARKGHHTELRSPWLTNGSHTQLEVARTILRLARRGWTSHSFSRPHRTNGNRSTATNPDTSPSTVAHANTFYRQLRVWAKTSLLDLFSTNFLILISILPLINLLSSQYSSFMVNSFLWLLRGFAHRPLAINFQVALVTGHITWIRVSLVLISFWSLILITSAHFYSIVYTNRLPTSRHRPHESNRSSSSVSRRLGGGTLDQFVNRVTRMLLQPSDVDNSTDTTGSSSSSSLSDRPLEAQSAAHVQTLESSTLIHRLNRLHRVLQNDDQTATVSSVSSASTLASDAHANQVISVPTAHIYSWYCPTGWCDKNESSSTLDVPSDSSKLDITTSPCEEDASDIEHVPVSEPNTETDDEEEQPSDVSPVRSDRSQRLCHKPQFPSCAPSRKNDLNSSDETLDASAHSELMPRKAVDWPSWVIPSEACVVCWCTFRPPIRLGALPCGHGFHDYCIRRWLDTGALDCPVCRWPAYAPHLRQQRQIIGQILSAIRSTFSQDTQNIVISESS